jgi:hypothetical protein
MSWKLWVTVALAVAIGFSVKYWQCGELFPDASRAACMMWGQ